MKDWIKRQWCRSGLHRWSRWDADLDEDSEPRLQARYCVWCLFSEIQTIQKFTIREILMEFAKRKG